MHINPRSLMTAGFAGGFILLIISFVADFATQFVTPYSIFEVPGMRSISDPVMMLYFVYPFIFAFIAAIIWQIIRGSLPENQKSAAWQFAGILFILVIVPNIWVMYTSMLYPTGFYISNILTGVIGYPAIGYLNARFNRGK
ncbi:hypothetical protein [Methanospirillum lacunae]|uniref:Uncharacterized protein n=2 Tax=Methanospirillum lacunae TaxID=668570 RepID=A0A2V2MYX2_9EURY|nr:hypothetical protein DK846_06820 [Methanospirillum lacunae]